MVKTHALMESISTNLGDFLHVIDADLAPPQKKFLRDGLIGLLRAGRPVVCRMARKAAGQAGAAFLPGRLGEGASAGANRGADYGGGPRARPRRAVHVTHEPLGSISRRCAARAAVLRPQVGMRGGDSFPEIRD